MAEYQIWLYDAWGNRVANVGQEHITKLTYALSVNSVGALTLTTTRDALPDQYVTRDARLEVWRKPDGGAPVREGDGPWLVQTDTSGLSDRDGEYRRIKAATANTILGRRAVLYYANTANTSKTGNADNVLKAIMRENLGTTANSSPLYSAGVTPSRDWVTPGLLAIDADASLGPSISKAFAWRNVLSVLQEIARDAATAGTPVFFDVVMVGTVLTFRTWVGVRGVDRSSGAAKLVISAERGSLGGTIEKTTDWSDSANWIVAGGQGQDAQRTLGSAYDLTRVGQSPYGLSEVFVDATSLSAVAALNADASSELRARRPSKILTGSLISVPGAVYGLDWGFGDKLIAEFEDDAFTATVDSVTVTLDGGKETVTAAIRGQT